MSENTKNIIKILGIVAAIVFLYANVLSKLGVDWWSDANYSHGLLVPFVIALIVWKEWDKLRSLVREHSVVSGGIAIVLAIMLLIAGTLGAELFTTRISFVLMLAGAAAYLFGTKVLRLLAVPFALLLLAVPIPQIIFNRIAFPLQLWASQMAVFGIRLFDVSTVRKGNVIEILPIGATQTISLEVVEACSGIRSLMTLVTLALILAYFTRRRTTFDLGGFTPPDLWRAVLLMGLAVPIAVITNAVRVSATGIFTYYYGRAATESTWHEISGFLVYVVALGLLIGSNHLLRMIFRDDGKDSPKPRSATQAWRPPAVLPLILLILLCGVAVNWLVSRGESVVQRTELQLLPSKLGDWRQRGTEIRFGEATESVLKTTDYTMREYTAPDGRVANLYVGYYASQRSGSTYHSPQNCLPGAGWEMKEPQYVDITTAGGRTFRANRYIVENGEYKDVMIYWYQGRGRIEANEYRDKANVILDSLTRRRSDGAIVRVMTSVGSDEAAADKAAKDLSAQLADSLGPFIPE